MQEAVYYLSKNPEVFEKIKNGEASLLGVTPKELKAILNSFLLTSAGEIKDYWR